MRAGQTIARLAAFAGRGPGTDAERRAAEWLAGQLREAAAQPRIDTFWCRPNRALAHAWHAALGLAGSLVAVADAAVGLAIVLVALASLLLDAWRGVSLGRRLTPERASQNVVASASGAGPARTRLIITANYDAGRCGVAYGRAATAVRVALRRAGVSRGPGWLAWLAVALVWVAVTAALRLHGTPSGTTGPLSLPPSAALVLAFALALEAGTASIGPAASDNASGTAVALALFSTLRAAAPRHLDVELVLCGAHEGGAIGLARHLRRTRARRADTIVLGLAACGAGDPVWWQADGALIPRHTAAPLRGLIGQLAARHPELGLRGHHGRGTSPAWPAYARRLPAVTLGALDARDLSPRSHRADDTPEAVDRRAPDRVLELALVLVDALDASIGAGVPRRDVRTA